MLDWLKRENIDTSGETEGAIVYDQAVILDITFQGMDEFGSEEEQAAIAQLENRINSILPSGSGVDGHEYGDREATVYIYGVDADDIFNLIKDILSQSMFQHIDVTLQYGAPDDPNTKDKKFTL